MPGNKKITIMYFTDVLCIWAYLAQIRMDELQKKYAENIEIQNYFTPVFGAVKTKMKNNWGEQGGNVAYSKHVQDIAKKFPHIQVHPDIWVKQIPTTSSSCHLFLKTIQLLEAREELGSITHQTGEIKSTFDTIAWAFRVAFFKDLIDISSVQAQMKMGETFSLPLHKIQQLLDSGEAYAALESDLVQKEKYGVTGSPTLVLNEGRQIIYGNVGYRVIDANIQELLSEPESQASWC